MTTTWNPADKSAATTLSSGNHVASSTAGNNGARGTTSKSSGKWYFELPVVNTGGSASGGYGVIDSVYDYGSIFPGGAFAVVAWDGSVQCSPSSTFSPGWGTVNGHALSIAIDWSLLKVWARYDGGNWNNDVIANQNPATGTGGYPIANFTGFIGCRMQNTGNVTMNAGDSAFTYTPPAGFTGWDVVLPPAFSQALFVGA